MTDTQPPEPKAATKFVQQSLKPEESRYVYDHAGLPFRCQFCVGQTFRRSRLRARDIKFLFLMRYPVRCLRCSQRQLVSFTLAGVSIPSHIRTQRRKQASQG